MTREEIFQMAIEAGIPFSDITSPAIDDMMEFAERVRGRYATDWVSVKDKLPVTDRRWERFLVVVDATEHYKDDDWLNGSNRRWVQFAGINHNNIWITSNDEIVEYAEGIYVTHWRPLPELPSPPITS